MTKRLRGAASYTTLVLALAVTLAGAMIGGGVGGVAAAPTAHAQAHAPMAAVHKPAKASTVQPLHIECQYTAWYIQEQNGPFGFSGFSETAYLYVWEDTTDRGYCGKMYAYGTYDVTSGCHTFYVAVIDEYTGAQVGGNSGGFSSCGGTGGRGGPIITPSSGYLAGRIWSGSSPVQTAGYSF